MKRPNATYTDALIPGREAEDSVVHVLWGVVGGSEECRVDIEVHIDGYKKAS